MKKPKIKLVYECDPTYPPMSGPRAAERGYSTARVLVQVTYVAEPMYDSSYKAAESVEIASKRFDWDEGNDSEQAQRMGAKWAAESIAAVFKKLWPETAED